jgi:hypothetical protein
MIVTYPIQTPAMQDAIEQATRTAKAQGYRTVVLLDIQSTGVGSWLVKLQVMR